MKEFFIKNNKTIIVVLIIILLSAIGITLAIDIYMDSIRVAIGTGNYNVVYAGTTTLPSSKLTPIFDSELLSADNADKIMKIDFTVKGAQTNPTDKPIIYDVSLTELDIPKALKSELLKWNLYKNGALVSAGNFSDDFDSKINRRMVLTEIQQDLPSYDSTADSYTFYIWLSEPCVGDITECTPEMDTSPFLNLSFSGNIRIELSTESKKALVRPTGTLVTEIASTKIMNLYNPDLCVPMGNGVCATGEYIDENGNTKYHDYRYIGAEPNNYVRFNGDMYRIIGVFDDYTHGIEGEHLVKLIRSEILYVGSKGIYSSLENISLGTLAGYSNDWTGNKTSDSSDDTSPASANIMLNEFFYNKINVSNVYGNCIDWTFFQTSAELAVRKTNSCTDIVGYGLNNSSRNYVEDVTWHLNGLGIPNATFSRGTVYNCERDNSSDETCMSGNSGEYDSTFIGKIGLMYASDYVYASSYYEPSNNEIDFQDTYLSTSNWLYKGYEWLQNVVSMAEKWSMYIGTSGDIYDYSVSAGSGVRPTFYLKGSTEIIGGSGAFDDPYILSM